MKATKKIFIFAALSFILISFSACRRCGGCPTWEMNQQK